MSDRRIWLPVLLSILLSSGAARADERWPELSTPASVVGGGEHDAAVVVGVEGYAFVAPVPGAESNAKLWHQYLTETRGLPPQNVKLLTGVDATREEILDAAAQAASRAGAKGTLWFVFIGHGAPSADGKDGLLIGVDAQQKAASLQSHSVKRSELMKVLAASKASGISVILDACFSGRGQDGSTIAPGLQPLLTVGAAGAIDPRMVVLTAAKGDQFAGPLPGANRPAFSYLVLGGLRGWAASGKNAQVTAGELWQYTKNALDATLRGRNQTPDLMGRESAVLGASAGETGPNLARLSAATAGGGAREEMFRVSSLGQVPRAQAPAALTDMGAGADFRDLDIAALKGYNAASVFDKGQAAAWRKAAMWRELAKTAPKFAEKAEERAAEWDRYQAELEAADEARWTRADARDKDWEKLSQLLPLEVVSAEDKGRWAAAFVQAYGATTDDNPHAAALDAYLPAGTVTVTPGGKSAAGIRWIRIPGGTFMMGSRESSNEKPVHKVTVKAFQMSKTEVTNGQYRACVAAGACPTPFCCVGKEKSAYIGGDEWPMIYMQWEEARTFAEWAGGRLPTEAEWEYAARSGGQEQKYPWGNEEPTCERVVMGGCTADYETMAVCSRPAGNTAQGLCDMAGNVWEWTEDVYHASYKGAPSDGGAWTDSTDTDRVARGGNSGSAANLLRSAGRYGLNPKYRYGLTMGFRIAR